MPELAAPLERAQELVNRILEYLDEGQLDEYADIAQEAMVNPVAAALAACAREEAKWWLEKAGRDGHFWIVSPIDMHPEDCRCEAHERLRALDRAVGEKA